MDLIILILGLALLGFLVWLITTKIPMDPTIRYIIQIIVVVVVIFYLIRILGIKIPNVL